MAPYLRGSRGVRRHRRAGRGQGRPRCHRASRRRPFCGPATAGPPRRRAACPGAVPAETSRGWRPTRRCVPGPAAAAAPAPGVPVPAVSSVVSCPSADLSLRQDRALFLPAGRRRKDGPNLPAVLLRLDHDIREFAGHAGHHFVAGAAEGQGGEQPQVLPIGAFGVAAVGEVAQDVLPLVCGRRRNRLSQEQVAVSLRQGVEQPVELRVTPQREIGTEGCRKQFTRQVAAGLPSQHGGGREVPLAGVVPVERVPHPGEEPAAPGLGPAVQRPGAEHQVLGSAVIGDAGQPGQDVPRASGGVAPGVRAAHLAAPQRRLGHRPQPVLGGLGREFARGEGFFGADDDPEQGLLDGIGGPPGKEAGGLAGGEPSRWRAVSAGLQPGPPVRGRGRLPVHRSGRLQFLRRRHGVDAGEQAVFAIPPGFRDPEVFRETAHLGGRPLPPGVPLQFGDPAFQLFADFGCPAGAAVDGQGEGHQL